MKFLDGKKNLITSINGFKDISLQDANSGLFTTTDIDPQLHFEFKKPLASGVYRFLFQFTLCKGKWQNSKIYIDTGPGYNELESVILVPASRNNIETIFAVQKSIRKIRFDFTEEPDVVFQVHSLSLEAISTLALFKKVQNWIYIELGQHSLFKSWVKAALLLFKEPIEEVLAKLNGNSWSSINYNKWIRLNDSYDSEALAAFDRMQALFAYKPLISVIVPVYNTKLEWLTACIQSVLDQVYTNWELCIVDDNSSISEVRDTIKEFAAKDARIKYMFRATNGNMAACSNTALGLATGAFVTFLDHDDTLSNLALFRIANALNENGNIDFIYTDEDKIDEKVSRQVPFFKPEWSPGLFYCQNYIAHLTCIRKDMVDAVGGFTEGLEGSQDYDLYLKVLSLNPRIQHLPYVLYHWRLHSGSTSIGSQSKAYAHEAGKKALARYLQQKYPLHFSHIQDSGQALIYKPHFKFGTEHKISIIIPTKDKIEYLEPCINSIIEKSTWRNYEILILDNNSTEAQTFDYFRNVQKQFNRVKVLDAFFEFNWSKLNNFGTHHASGDYLIFLNNDISVITADWMQELCAWAALPDVATVGATLLYEDNTIQHAGVVLGMNGWADHIFKSMTPQYFSTPHVSNNIPRNVLAVTGACTAIERKKFEALGMFDEDFIVCGSDVELGVRAYKSGLFNVLNAYVQLYHYESKSRGSAVPENDFVQSAIKYEPYRTQQYDPFYNPNLSLSHTIPVCKL